MVRFAQISFKVHEHVVCSPFESRVYFIKKNIQNMELNILISFLCTREYMYNIQDSKTFVRSITQKLYEVSI